MDTADLRNEIERGAGALLLTEEVLNPATIEDLAEILRTQLPWSDLPVLVFAGGRSRAEGVASAIRELAEHADITLLDRPTRKITLVSALQAALRARRRQYEVRDLLLQLERGVRERDRFLAMLSHELRNPLAAILTANELMEHRDPRAFVHERAVVNRQARVLSRLVDDLLDLSRLTLGKIGIAKAPVDVAELVARSRRGPPPDRRERRDRAGDRVGPDALHGDRGSRSPRAGDEQPPRQCAQVHASRGPRHGPVVGRRRGGRDRRRGHGRRDRRQGSAPHLRAVHAGGRHDRPVPGRPRNRPHAGAASGRASRRVPSSRRAPAAEPEAGSW